MDLSSIIGKVLEIGAIAAKYQTLALDATETFNAAMRGELTGEEIQAEIDRIKTDEHDQVAADWQVVNS